MLLADLVFAFMWVTYQAFRMKPINRETFPENLIKHAKENEFPVVDVLICTADPFKEPLMRVVNTCLSVMAYDYPTQKLSFYVAEDGRFYAAICAAPAVALGSWGLLKEKKATCYPSFMEQLSSAAIVVESIVQQDGKVVTSRGPDTAMEFIVALVEQLFGKDIANEVSGPLVSLQVHHSLNFSEYRTMVLSSLSGSEAHSKYFGGRPMQQQ